MSFTAAGVLLILLSVHFFFYASRWLYLATVLLIPFSAMAVLNAGWSGGE